MRLIDADRLKLVLEKNFGEIGGNNVLQQIIDKQPTIKPSASEWHVVADGDLPEEKWFYQCTVLDNHKNEVFIADVYKEAAGFFFDNELYEVIAWRELPEPWEGAEK